MGGGRSREERRLRGHVTYTLNISNLLEGGAATVVAVPGLDAVGGDIVSSCVIFL